MPVYLMLNTFKRIRKIELVSAEKELRQSFCPQTSDRTRSVFWLFPVEVGEIFLINSIENRDVAFKCCAFLVILFYLHADSN